MSATTWGKLPLADPPSYNEDTDVLIRQSTINNLLLCGQRVALKGTPGYLKAVSEPLVFGTCLHYLIEEDLKAGDRRHDLLANMEEWVEHILVEDYDWSLDVVPSPGDLFGELSMAYRMWASNVLPKLPKQLVAIEEKMELYLGESEGGGGVFLQGSPDLVTESAIIDWKTAGRGWKDTKATLGSLQPTLYPPLVKQSYGDAPRRFTFWVYNRQKNFWESFSTQKRKVATINAGLETAYMYGLQIESGHLPPTPLDENYFEYKRAWYCSPRYCEAWNVCPYKGLVPDDADLNVQAIRSW